MTRRLFIDANVLLFAMGGEHRYREPCRRLLSEAMGDVYRLHASVEAIQEFCFHRMRRGDTRADVARHARHWRTVVAAQAFDDRILLRMIDLVATTTVRGRDAVHAATALEHGFTEIVTVDRDFDGIPGLSRVDPHDL